MSDEDVPGEPGWFLDPWTPGQLRYFDGQHWTDAVGTPPASTAQRYPLGHQVFRVRASPQRWDLSYACAIEDDQGGQLAVIRQLPSTNVSEHLGATMRFAMHDPNGLPMGHFVHTGRTGTREILSATDAFGRDAGTLRRTNGW